MTATRPPMGLYPVRVARTETLSPHFVRLTLIGEPLAGLPFAGPDQRVKLLLPRPGQDRVHVGDIDGPRDILALPDDVRPIMRTYTVRNHRPGEREVDIDFALHGTPGPASRWAVTARPGDHAALYRPAASYLPPVDNRWSLIVGDESALPAIGAILEDLPAGAGARVLAEVPDERDSQPFECAADADVTWLVRRGTPAERSRLLANAVRALTLPERPYVWLAGEASIVTSIRRHLVLERGIDRAAVTFTGYWRHGRTENDA
jgi:NADPH-dependent ferric siderophore reductase